MENSKPPETADKAYINVQDLPADLSSEEVRFEESNASKFISEMDDDEIRNYIHVCLREIQRWRIHEKHARLGKAKLALDSDGNIIKAIREAKPKKARAEGKSPLTKAIESMAGLLGISFDEAKEIVEKQKGGG